MIDDESHIIISKLTYIKFYLFKEINDDIRNKIYIEMKDYYKILIMKMEINKIINSLNLFGRCYYIYTNNKNKKKIIYKDCMNDIIRFNNYNLFYN